MRHHGVPILLNQEQQGLRPDFRQQEDEDGRAALEHKTDAFQDGLAMVGEGLPSPVQEELLDDEEDSPEDGKPLARDSGGHDDTMSDDKKPRARDDNGNGDVVVMEEEDSTETSASEDLDTSAVDNAEESLSAENGDDHSQGVDDGALEDMLAAADDDDDNNNSTFSRRASFMDFHFFGKN